mmetsp:Transcript_3825/g.8434  ORF Transcript_3825/g.8434 Transcript_3825/m.8434 type:complete len:268 (-) Transcript_3825:220-1023(-)
MKFSIVTFACLMATSTAIRVGSPVSREEFCEDMGDLETHLKNSFEAFMGSSYPSSYECFCSGMLGLDLQINCSLQYSDGGVVFVNEEKITFRFDKESGMYQLTETSWNDTSFGSFIPQEVFSFDNGVLSSCKANGCSSCTICQDKTSIAVDCSGLEGGLDYSYECGDGNTGSFSNTFDFNMITEESDAVDKEPANPSKDSATTEVNPTDIVETNEDSMGDIGDAVALDSSEVTEESDSSDFDGISPAASRSIAVATVGIILATFLFV